MAYKIDLFLDHDIAIAIIFPKPILVWITSFVSMFETFWLYTVQLNNNKNVKKKNLFILI